MTREAFILTPDNARARMAAAWRFACRFLELGTRARVTVEEYKPTRSADQNAMFHALCQDIAAARPNWAGHPIDAEGWKRLLVDAWARTEGGVQGRIVPSLDGSSVVNLGVQTRRLKVGEMADLITYVQAWAVDNGVPLNDQPKWRDAA